MEPHTANTEFRLEPNRPLRLQRAVGATLVCLSGTLWITCEGDGADVFLRAGERHRVARGGMILVEGIGNARLGVQRSPDLPDRLLAAVRQRFIRWGKWADKAA